MLIFDQKVLEVAILNVYLLVVSKKSLKLIFVFWFRVGGRVLTIVEEFFQGYLITPWSIIRPKINF